MTAKVLINFPSAPTARTWPTAVRHAHKRARVVPLDSGNTAAPTVETPIERSANKVEIAGRNLEGWRENSKEAILQGGPHNRDGKDPTLEENKQWHATAFPSYLQSEKDDFCQSWEESLQDVERRQSLQQGISSPKAVTASNPVWQAMRKEAQRDAAKEPLLSSFMYASILSHDTFLECLAFVLANRLSDPTMLATEYYETFITVFNEEAAIVQAALDDIQAVCERDPACGSYSNALLFYKGYQAIQVHRIAHHLWNLGQKIAARNLQSRVSQVFAMDIHPQAKFGKGILMDHGTGIVVGQTAVVGNNVSILQNVTLGGTGKSDGDRHPKISDNVLIGAGATILGNITVGKGAMVASGSLVLKPVPSKTMVAGSPAKEVGQLTGNPALKMQHWLKTINPDSDPFCEPFEGMLRSKAQQQSAKVSEAGQPVKSPAAAHEVGGTGRDKHHLQGTERDAELPADSSPQKVQCEHERVHQDRASASVRAHESSLGSVNNGGRQNLNGKRVASPQYYKSSVLLDSPTTGKDESSSAGDTSHLENGSKASHVQEPGTEEAVIGVRSDTKANKLWPQGPEPEYYL